MPNILASLMLAIWPLVGLFLFRRLGAAQAVLWTLLAGYLLLPPPPAAFDFPLLPPLSKDTIPSLVAFAGVVLTLRGRVQLLPQSWLARGLLLIFVLSPMATFATNTDPVFFGSVGLPGMRFSEGIALIVQQAMLVIPFLLARALLGDNDGQRTILWAIFAGGLAYSLPMLLEIRLSPQLNNWIYGYYQHYFAQSLRFGGFRPLVFLNHGLWAAFFAMTAFVAALALWRGTKRGASLGYLLAAGYLGVVLILCKSLGAAIYGILFVPVLVLLNSKWHLHLAALLAIATLAYPVLKAVDLVPDDQLVSRAAEFDQNRGASLQFRFDNEDILFERASKRPAFGWGTWGRNHILDPQSGEITTVTDGRWIITLGVFGWLGFIAEFGLLSLPIFAMWLQARRRGAQISPFSGPLALLLAVNMVDLIPNATLTPITWLIAGALLGAAEMARTTYKPPQVDTIETIL